MSPSVLAQWPADAPGQESVEVSIVVPCLNEELTVGEFVDWCHEGLAAAGVNGEVLIVDSSSDRSPAIAAAHGARVITVPPRGLGRAYIDAIPHIHGEIAIMGDCDLTYDFRELEGFIRAIRGGHDFVMGTRTKGDIERGAMPALHRYFGSPATTAMFNLIYGTRFSDIHCGMRAITRGALERMELESHGWEYASEMILKARKLEMRTTEVPVRFWKDRDGRESHLKRAGWRAPWIAGWDSLRVMFLYAPDFFLLRPGLVLLAIGLLIAGALAGGPFVAMGVGFDLHWMLLGIVLATVGYSAVQLAMLARVFYDFDQGFTDRLLARFAYNRGMLASGVLLLAGVAPNTVLLVRWLSNDFHLPAIQYSSVFGLLLVMLGFQTFGFTLLLHMIGRSARLRRSGECADEARRTPH
jgi:glycosyltransferase involved in cell wall biosynthesis